MNRHIAAVAIISFCTFHNSADAACSQQEIAQMRGAGMSQQRINELCVSPSKTDISWLTGRWNLKQVTTNTSDPSVRMGPITEVWDIKVSGSETVQLFRVLDAHLGDSARKVPLTVRSSQLRGQTLAFVTYENMEFAVAQTQYTLPIEQGQGTLRGNWESYITSPIAPLPPMTSTGWFELSQRTDGRASPETPSWMQ
ncbi:MAG: hypothetical protein GYB68_06315 [Chloroflexi bacterium]|nr:hypothetical protein [Chloroflexota bacterium]